MLNLRTTAYACIHAMSLMGLLFLGTPARALDLDWHGQFRAETNWLWGYSNGLLKPVAGADDGYAAYLNGDSPASFQNLFLSLSPRVIVNDNVSLHSDFWLGLPDKGMFGSDQFQTTINNPRAGNAAVTANTFFAEVATDFGTITVGRAPLNWGLGVVWNYDSSRFYRLPTTGDSIRLVTKLGAFRFMPSIVKYGMGTNYGGTLTGGTTVAGSSNVSDYSVGLSYQNDDEQMDLGILFLRRLTGQNANVQSPFGTGTVGYAYNIWDFYAKKHVGILTMAAEVPLVSGFVAGQDYSTVAGAAKIDVQVNEKWKVKLNLGMANGQENMPAASSSQKLTAFSFHPDYRPGFLMYNYQLRNFSDSAASPYNNPITNTRFASLGLNYASGKWAHEVLGLFAVADKTASGVAGDKYFNNWTGRYETQNAGALAQESSLGFEVDYSLAYEWDEALALGVNLGLFMPGKFYEFSNSATNYTLKTVFGSSVNLRVLF